MIAGAMMAMMAWAASGWAAPATEGAALGEWTMDVDAAKALAAETGKPMLFNFTGSDWCGWCIRMDNQVFSKEDWQAYAKDNLVLVWIDFPRDKSLVPEAYADRNQKLSEEFGVQGFPTYFLLDSDGDTRLGQAGASREATPEWFIGVLESLILTSEKSVAALREKMSEDERAQLDAAQAAVATARQTLEDWILTEPERSDENIAAFQSMNDNIREAEAAVLSLLKAAQ